MRIVLVSRELAPLGGGGIGTYASVMARAFRDAGHEVHVVTQDWPDLTRAGLAGIQLHPVKVDEGRAGHPGFPSYPARYAMGVLDVLERLDAAAPLDFVEFPEFYGEGAFALQAKRYLGRFPNAVFAVRLHTPTHEARELNRETWFDLETALLDVQETTSIRLADLVLSPTRSLLDKVRARVELSALTEVVPNPFLVEDVAPKPDAGEAGRLQVPSVLYVGRIERRKGVHLLADACVALWDAGRAFRWELIGGDTATGPHGTSMLDFVRARIPARHAHRVHHRSSLSRAELGPAMRAATVCCFPSLWENFPNVCLEAMSVGGAVLGSDAGGMAEIIEPGRSGWLFRGGDASDLVRALGDVLDDPEAQRAVRQAAPGRIQSLCDPQDIVRQVETLIQQARGSRVPPRTSRAPSTAPDVSVLVPFFNMGAYLGETLDSLDAQTFRRFEVLLVDDGSTAPGTEEALEAARARGVQVIRQEHRGVSAARNAALRRAQGKWVLPLDPDDLIAPDFLEKTTAVLEAHPNVSFATSLARFFQRSPSEPTGGWVPMGLQRDVLPVLNVASTCTALTRKEHLEELGGWDEWLSAFEDWDVFCGLAERGREGAVLPEFLFFYRVRPDSLMRTVVADRSYRLRSYLLAKHPGLALHWDRAMRLEMARAAELANAAGGITGEAPLRYRLVDQVNAQLKRVPGLQAVLRRAGSRLARR